VDPRPLWSRVKTATLVFAAAIALVLVWLAYAAIRGAIELPHARAAGAITPALQRFASATWIVVYAAEALLSGAALMVAFWVVRRIQRRTQTPRRVRSL
jgi:hypothetical protein